MIDDTLTTSEHEEALAALLLSGSPKHEKRLREHDVLQRAEIERLRASLATARREALEEAAALCDGYALHCECPYPGSCKHRGATDCARAIRSVLAHAPEEP